MTLTRTPLALALAALTLALPACTSEESAAQAAVRDGLKDPDSARFGEFYYNAKLKRGCMTVNAKNSMGGYTGDQQVSLSRSDEGWRWIDSSEQTQETCRTVWADNADIKD